MDTYIPASYKQTWSHSSLTAFETCPLRFWAEKIAKIVVDKPHPATEWGTQVHKALEDNGKGNVPLPSNMVQHSQYAEAIKRLTESAPIAKFEYQMAVTTSMTPCDWHAPTVFGRAIADVAVVNPAKAFGIIVDHKGLALDTPIATPDGFTTMGEIKVGDKVFDVNGNQCAVTVKSQVKHIGCYEIEFDCGEKIVCDEEHLWLRSDGNVVLSMGLAPKHQRQSVPIAGKLETSVNQTRVLPDALVAIQQQQQTKRRHVVLSVREINSVPTQCIGVDSESHTFLCGKNLIPTHNTGKYRGPTAQAVVNAKMLMVHHPEVEVVKTQFNYLKEDVSKTEEFYRSTIDHEFAPVQRSIDNLTLAVMNNNFPARRSGLCKAYCPYTKCAFNGRRS